MLELPQGHGLDLGLVGDLGPRQNWSGQVSVYLWEGRGVERKEIGFILN